MLSSKKFEKIVKILGEERVNEIRAKSKEDLKEQIVQSEQAIKQAEEDLEAKPQYQRLKEDLKDISQGLKEVRKYQKAITQLCLSNLEENGNE